MVVRCRETVLTSVLPLIAGELNVNDVPVVIFPVFVMESAALASYAERGKKKKGAGSHQKFDPVRYSGTRTSNAEVTGALDESPCDGENLWGSQSHVKGLRDGLGTLHHVQDRLVTRLDGHYGGSGHEDGWVIYELRSTHVRCDAGHLDNTRDRCHGRDTGKHAGEVELAGERSDGERAEERLKRNEAVRVRI